MKRLTTLLLIFFAWLSSTEAQSIIVVGKVQNADVVRLTAIHENFRNAERGYRKLSLIYKDDPDPFEYKRKDKGKYKEVNYWISSLISRSNRVEEVDVSNLILFAENEANRSTLIIYDPLGKKNKDPLTFTDFEEFDKYVKSEIAKKIRITVLYIARNPTPVFLYTTPTNMNKVKNRRFSGEVRYAKPIKAVIFKVDDGPWKRARGTNFWNISLELNAETYNRVQTAVVDFNNDTSNLSETLDVFYTKSSIRNPAITYLFPNENSEVVPKCFHGTYSFKISFSADEAIELEELVLNIRDVDGGNNVLNWQLSEYQNNMFSFSTNHGVQYCVFIEFKWIEKEICDFNIDNRYELFFTYGNREIIMPRPLAVRFSSFDDKYKYLDCDCN